MICSALGIVYSTHVCLAINWLLVGSSLHRTRTGQNDKTPTHPISQIDKHCDVLLSV